MTSLLHKCHTHACCAAIEQDAPHSHAEVKKYLTAMEKAASEVSRWKQVLPTQHEEMMALMQTTHDGLAGGLDSAAFKSECDYRWARLR